MLGPVDISRKTITIAIRNKFIVFIVIYISTKYLQNKKKKMLNLGRTRGFVDFVAYLDLILSYVTNFPSATVEPTHGVNTLGFLYHFSNWNQPCINTQNPSKCSGLVSYSYGFNIFKILSKGICIGFTLVFSYHKYRSINIRGRFRNQIFSTWCVRGVIFWFPLLFSQ